MVKNTIHIEKIEKKIFAFYVKMNMKNIKLYLIVN